jgi:hypothetical protein
MKSKVASIRALQELKEIVESRKRAKFNVLLIEEENRRTEIHNGLSSKIQKEIEEYAVEKYKDVGLAVIPLCHRSSSFRDSDVVRPELRIKTFSQGIAADKEIAKLKEQSEEASVQIDDWYFRAVQAVAEQANLPPTPEF